MTRGVIRKCPCCGTRIRKGQIMCRPHWLLVPVEARKAVNAAWALYRAAPLGQPTIAALAAYQRQFEAACQAALVKLENQRSAA